MPSSGPSPLAPQIHQSLSGLAGVSVYHTPLGGSCRASLLKLWPQTEQSTQGRWQHPGEGEPTLEKGKTGRGTHTQARPRLTSRTLHNPPAVLCLLSVGKAKEKDGRKVLLHRLPLATLQPCSGFWPRLAMGTDNPAASREMSLNKCYSPRLLLQRVRRAIPEWDIPGQAHLTDLQGPQETPVPP